MFFKKAICILTAVLTVFCCLPMSSSAYSGKIVLSESVAPEYRLSAPDCAGTESSLSRWADVEEFREFLFENISNAQIVIDISGFNFPYSAWEDIVNLIFYGIPEAFGVYDIMYSHNYRELYTLHLGYRSFADTAEEYSVCIKKMEAAADILLSGVENNPGLSDEYKALLLHDRLCVNTEYPYYADVTEVEHTAYGALVNRISVCQGYAMAYMYLLNRVGIKNYYCSSGSLNHAWNVVYIGGKPYHVDTTFDDINWETDDGRNVAGALRHDYFLLSTKTLRSRDHNAYDFDSAPTDTKYDNYYWRSSLTEFQFIGNKLYYIDNKQQALMCVGESEKLYDVSSIWYAGTSSYWSGNYSRLSSAGGELFFSLADSIYKYTVMTGECKKILSPYLHQRFSIYGFTYENGMFRYDVNIAPPGGDITYLKHEEAPYGDISHIMNRLEAHSTGNYYIGDSLKPENVVVTAYFTDGTKKLISSGAEFSDFDSTQAGNKTVTVKYGGLSAEFIVTVKTPAVKLSAERVNVAVGNEFTLTALTEPALQTVTWKSSSDKIHIADGRITALSIGTADVTAEIIYNGRAYSAVCHVNVECAHKNTELHKEIPPTAEAVGYTEGVFCKDCLKYISGHNELPRLDLSFSSSDFMHSDGSNVYIIAGKLVTELLWSAPYGSFVEDKNGNSAGERNFVSTGMVLVLPDNSGLPIVVCGDVDGDAGITAADARLALRASVGLESYSPDSPYSKAADVDKDKSLSAADARLILRASVGLEDNTLWL